MCGLDSIYLSIYILSFLLLVRGSIRRLYINIHLHINILWISDVAPGRQTHLPTHSLNKVKRKYCIGSLGAMRRGWRGGVIECVFCLDVWNNIYGIGSTRFGFSASVVCCSRRQIMGNRKENRPDSGVRIF